MRVIIIAAVKLYREGLAHVLERRSDVTVTCAAVDLDDAMRQGACLQADVVLFDVSGDQPACRVRAVHEALPRARIIGLGLCESSEEEAVECLQAGLSGYVPLSGCIEDLLATLERVGRGEMIASPRIIAGLARRLADFAGHVNSTGARLTSRETEVAQLMDRGLSNKEIASQLGVQVATVKNHIHNILEKLCVRRRGEAVATLRRGSARRTPTHVT